VTLRDYTGRLRRCKGSAGSSISGSFPARLEGHASTGCGGVSAFVTETVNRVEIRHRVTRRQWILLRCSRLASRLLSDSVLTHLLEGCRVCPKEDPVGTLTRFGLAIGIAVAIAGCSTPRTSREKGIVAGDGLTGNTMQGAEQQPTPPVPMRVVVASPPPVLAQSPRYIWVPEWGVYILEGHDIVYSDGYHFYFYEAHWYVARTCAGPWALISSPPPTLAAVPPGHFHKRMPPGLARKDGVPPGHTH
jgi:hypothetical protein